MFVVGALLIAAALNGFAARPAAAAATPVDLGTAKNFAVLGGSALTNTGPTTVTGSVGIYPGLASSVTGFSTVTILQGSTHYGDAVAQTAQTDLTTAYNAAAGQAPTATVAGNLGGQILIRGVYNSASSLGLTGTLTLDGLGDPNSVFIFQAGSTLTTGSGSSVVLINGAQACNVFWQVGSSATLGTTTSFKGDILALTSITLNTGATVTGSVLARNGAVTMDTNTIAVSSCNVVTTTSTTAPPTTMTTASTSSSTTTTTTASTNSTITTTTTPTNSTTTTITTPNTCANPQSPVSLTVNTKNTNGTDLPGIYILYNCFDGQTTSTGFSPISFAVVPGDVHVVGVLDFGCYVFDHWSDTGSALRYRNFSITSDTTMTALYSDGCHPVLSPSKSTISVSSVDMSSNTIQGVYTTAWLNGTLLQICFTTCSFTVNNGQTYQVAVADFAHSIFDHWRDGTTARFHTVVVGNSRTNISLTAVFSVGLATGTSMVSISLHDSSGKALVGSGYFTTLWQNGKVSQTCFSPCFFTVQDGQTYQVGVADFGGFVFDHWSDGTTTRLHTVVVGNASTSFAFTAVFKPAAASTTTTTTIPTTQTSTSSTASSSNESGEFLGIPILDIVIVLGLILLVVAALSIRRSRRPKRIR